MRGDSLGEAALGAVVRGLAEVMFALLRLSVLAASLGGTPEYALRGGQAPAATWTDGYDPVTQPSLEDCGPMLTNCSGAAHLEPRKQVASIATGDYDPWPHHYDSRTS